MQWQILNDESDNLNTVSCTTESKTNKNDDSNTVQSSTENKHNENDLTAVLSPTFDTPNTDRTVKTEKSNVSNITVIENPISSKTDRTATSASNDSSVLSSSAISKTCLTTSGHHIEPDDENDTKSDVVKSYFELKSIRAKIYGKDSAKQSITVEICDENIEDFEQKCWQECKRGDVSRNNINKLNIRLVIQNLNIETYLFKLNRKMVENKLFMRILNLVLCISNYWIANEVVIDETIEKLFFYDMIEKIECEKLKREINVYHLHSRFLCTIFNPVYKINGRRVPFPRLRKQDGGGYMMQQTNDYKFWNEYRNKYKIENLIDKDSNPNEMKRIREMMKQMSNDKNMENKFVESFFSDDRPIRCNDKLRRVFATQKKVNKAGDAAIQTGLHDHFGLLFRAFYQTLMKDENLMLLFCFEIDKQKYYDSNENKSENESENDTDVKNAEVEKRQSKSQALKFVPLVDIFKDMSKYLTKMDTPQHRRSTPRKFTKMKPRLQLFEIFIDKFINNNFFDYCEIEDNTSFNFATYFKPGRLDKTKKNIVFSDNCLLISKKYLKRNFDEIDDVWLGVSQVKHEIAYPLERLPDCNLRVYFCSIELYSSVELGNALSMASQGGDLEKQAHSEYHLTAMLYSASEHKYEMTTWIIPEDAVDDAQDQYLEKGILVNFWDICKPIEMKNDGSNTLFVPQNVGIDGNKSFISSGWCTAQRTPALPGVHNLYYRHPV